jgi:hypothetical protein
MERAKNIARTTASPPAACIVSPDDRVAAGKALRDKIPREQHGLWNEVRGRLNPIDLLQKSDAGRLKKLIPIRYGRMLRSPFAFYRGAAGVMAADLALTPTTGLKVQACGDCHLLNFGGFATPERSIIFDINDFDETLPAPWEWDVKRLVASIMLAARSNGLSDNQGRDCVVSCARRYREHMHEFSKMDPLRVWYAETSATDFIESLPKALRKSVKKRVGRTAAHSGSEFDFPKAIHAGREHAEPASQQEHARLSGKRAVAPQQGDGDREAAGAEAQTQCSGHCKNRHQPVRRRGGWPGRHGVP